MHEKHKKINSFKKFHKLIPILVKKINEDKNLGIRAAVNPLLAFEEMGYVLSKEVQKKVERFIRFTPEERKRLNELEKQIYEVAGHTFDIDSPETLEKLLFKELKIAKPKDIKGLGLPEPDKAGAELIKRRKVKWVDPLNSLEGVHPIISPLVSYRKIQASRPGLAQRSLYEELKTGKRRLPISRIRVRFPEQHEEMRDG